VKADIMPTAATGVADVVVEFAFPNELSTEVRTFLDFLRKAGRKFSVPLWVREARGGRWILSVPWKNSWSLDMLLHDLVFHRGLYYYLCTVSNRRQIAASVVKPIFDELLSERFSVSYPVSLQKHLIEGSGDWVGGNFGKEGTAQKYEILFNQFNLKMISGYEFVRNLDDLLTEFMLFQLSHPKGTKSPKFNVLVDMCGKRDILRDKRIRKLFNEVHSLRTRGLHRLEREVPAAKLSEVAQSMYNTFEWLDDFWEAQDRKTVVFSGKKYRRVRYGEEMRVWKRHALRSPIPQDFAERWAEVIKSPCHDCGVIVGELHLNGCDVETCPRCSGQFLCCDCWIEES
jgi:hypothetical protein